jgi:hypothetical protein
MDGVSLSFQLQSLKEQPTMAETISFLLGAMMSNETMSHLSRDVELLVEIRFVVV